MRGINLGKIFSMVEKDVKLIKREAVFLLEINSECEVNFLENPSGRIDVFAVIGPVESFAISEEPIISNQFNKAVLFELGIRRDKPYHESINTKRCFGELKNFHKRRQWFKLSERQFLKVAPIIFDFMQRLTNAEVKKWKCNPLTNPFWLETTKDWYSRKRGFEFYNKRYMPIRGKRFSIALKDSAFINYIYFSELKYQQNELSSFAKFISLVLAKKEGKRRLYKKMSPADFIKIVGGVAFSSLKDIIVRKGMPLYLCEEMIEKYFPSGENNIFYHEIKHLFGVNGEKSLERVFAECAIISSDCPVLNLKITTGLNLNKDHIVFEVFPTLLDSFIEKFEFEEVPF